MKVIKIIGNDQDRKSGWSSFPAPQEKDIGREVMVTRNCLTWDGVLGYFADDPNKERYAFYTEELR